MMSTATPFTLCVYCGSRHGHDPAYSAAARLLGQQIGQRGWRLVYGGGRVGLMGEVADAALDAGAEVIGVIPELLMGKEVGHHALTELHVVRSMHERKKRMAELAHAFVALPGGIGTLEELFEVWTWRHLGYHDQPIGLLNVAGFYDPLLAFIQHTEQAGFLYAQQQSMLTVAADPVALLEQLAQQSAQSGGADNYSRI